jgi:hypothetical protein
MLLFSLRPRAATNESSRDWANRENAERGAAGGTGFPIPPAGGKSPIVSVRSEYLRLELGDDAIRVNRRFIVSDDVTVVINFDWEVTLMNTSAMPANGCQ